jgi:Flp pilus assembly pilin Flp
MRPTASLAAATSALHRRAGEDGQTSAEYVGIIVVVAVLVLALATNNPVGAAIRDAISATIDRITSSG